MRQGAVGHVRLVEHHGRRLVEKRMTDPARHDTEVLALRSLAGSGLPVPEIVRERPGSILMTLMPGERLDTVGAEERLEGLAASAVLLRRLHGLQPPAALPAAPADALAVERYLAAGGPPLPFVEPPASPSAFCHGDWGDGNLLAARGSVTAVVDWEAAHVGDPIRELARAAWGASRKDPRSASRIIDAYRADPAHVQAWYPIHAAHLWLWFSHHGPPEYLEQLTTELERWSDG